jgi:hypothetical protein
VSPVAQPQRRLTESLGDERHNRHDPSPFDRGGQRALMHGAVTRDTSRNQFPTFGHKPTQNPFIHVRDILHVIFAETTNFPTALGAKITFLGRFPSYKSHFITSLFLFQKQLDILKDVIIMRSRGRFYFGWFLPNGRGGRSGSLVSNRTRVTGGLAGAFFAATRMTAVRATIIIILVTVVVVIVASIAPLIALIPIIISSGTIEIFKSRNRTFEGDRHEPDILLFQFEEPIKDRQRLLRGIEKQLRVISLAETGDTIGETAGADTILAQDIAAVPLDKIGDQGHLLIKRSVVSLGVDNEGSFVGSH